MSCITSDPNVWIPNHVMCGMQLLHKMAVQCLRMHGGRLQVPAVVKDIR